MKLVRMFFVAVALLMVTAGVFAGSAKFATLTLYVSQTGAAGTFTQVSSSATSFPGLSTSGTVSPVTLNDGANNIYTLYYAQSSTAKVYATGW